MGGYSACSVSRCFRSSGAVPVPGMHGESGGSVMISPFSLYEVLRYMLPGAAGNGEADGGRIARRQKNQEGLDFSVW
ncbi:MAG: hypothetical protein ACLT8E_00930 [Akkermansia sp.]